MLPWLHAIPYPDIDPVFLRLGPLQFRWYGLMYLIGLTLAYFIIGARAKAQRLPLDKDYVYDMIVYAAVGVFAGGRLGYVLFYNLSYYLENPLKILAVWEGGMSFHGGLIGTIVALILFAKRQGMTVLTVADLAAGVTPVGLGLGRIGNFINGELWGRFADPALPWGMVFPQSGSPLPRHPSQLYQFGLEGVTLFVILWWFGRKPRPLGQMSAAFLMGYGAFRFTAEYFREPDSFLGLLSFGLSMGQWLCVPMIVAGALLWRWSARQARA